MEYRLTISVCPKCRAPVDAPDGASEVHCPDCGTDFRPDDLLQPGAIIGGCVIEERIGSGGMGCVYRARHQRLNRIVAIKALSSRAHEQDEKYVERFLNEARAGASIDHPNVVHIYDAGEENGILFIQSAHVGGQTLKDLIDAQPLTLDWALDIMDQTLRGLTAVHRAGLLHRDVKPQNFMVSDEGNVKLMDFGLAKPLLSDRDRKSVV